MALSSFFAPLKKKERDISAGTETRKEERQPDAY
jgi:hypothetical protein